MPLSAPPEIGTREPLEPIQPSRDPIRPEVDLEYCKGCGICAEECPTNAIVMVEEGGLSKEDRG